MQIQSGSTAVLDLHIESVPNAGALEPVGLRLPIAAPTADIIVLPEEDDDLQESAIYVHEAGSERLVTIIEVLSYSNKETGKEKRARYLTKRREALESGIHLVEIDLLRGGQRVVDGLPQQPYHLLVSRADEQPQGHVWSFGFDEEIPMAPLPLSGRDERVPLPLSAALNSIYAARGFRFRLDYLADPPDSLAPSQKQQIHTILIRENLRTDAGHNGSSA